MMTEDASPTDRTDRATVAALLDLSHQLGDLTWCYQQPLVQALDQETMTDTQMHDLLKSSQVFVPPCPRTKKWLVELPASKRSFMPGC